MDIEHPEPPFFVLPSVSEASLTLFGMTLHEETPRLTPRGDKKERLGATKISSR
jgi:hypothetical protein